MTSTPTVGRDNAADLLVARVAVRTAPTLAETSAAERLSQAIERDARRAGVDLDVFAIDDAATDAYFAQAREEALTRALRDPSQRARARAELARRSS